jgi:hypothetical protein
MLDVKIIDVNTGEVMDIDELTHAGVSMAIMDCELLLEELRCKL